jgi:hypothetical protein
MPSRVTAKPTMNVHLHALKNDVQLTAANVAKSGDTKPATLDDLSKWLNAALKSPVDGPQTLHASGARPGAPALGKEQLSKVLSNLSKQIDNAEKAKGADVKQPSQAELRQWANDALVKAAEGQVLVHAKGGGTRPATADEIRGWLQ